jgi:cobalt-zinc-cadmium efflux system protein
MQRCECSDCDWLQGKLPIPEEQPNSPNKLRLLGAGLLLSGGFALAEYGMGWWSHSLALVADSSHMFSDCLAMGLSLTATVLARWAASRSNALGTQRAELLAALANGIGLVVVASWIVWEAMVRFHSDHPAIASQAMLLTAIVGLGFNAVTVSLLHNHSHNDLNIRGAFLHVLADTVSSIGVIVAALLVWLLHWDWADGVISLITAGLIGLSAIGLIRESLQALPR